MLENLDPPNLYTALLTKEVNFPCQNFELCAKRSVDKIQGTRTKSSLFIYKRAYIIDYIYMYYVHL